VSPLTGQSYEQKLRVYYFAALLSAAFLFALTATGGAQEISGTGIEPIPAAEGVKKYYDTGELKFEANAAQNVLKYYNKNGTLSKIIDIKKDYETLYSYYSDYKIKSETTHSGLPYDRLSTYTKIIQYHRNGKVKRIIDGESGLRVEYDEQGNPGLYHGYKKWLFLLFALYIMLLISVLVNLADKKAEFHHVGLIVLAVFQLLLFSLGDVGGFDTAILAVVFLPILCLISIIVSIISTVRKGFKLIPLLCFCISLLLINSDLLGGMSACLSGF